MKTFFLTLCLLIYTSFLSQTCATISDGTYGNSQTSPFAPVYGLYNYSWSSTIYNSSDIGSAKTIASLAWYVDEFQSGYSQSGPYTFNNVQIYFAYTTLSGWAGTNSVSGLNRLTGVNVAQGITSWTKVFDGSITFNASNVYKTITLTNPFSYDGVSNLVVHVDNNDGSWSSGYPIFHYTTYNTATSTRTMKYGAQDASMGPTSGSRSYQRPDIKFCTSVVLPIELIYFKPTYKNGIVNLEWSTATEHNNDYFTIEKSIDGEDFQSIGTVKSVGESTKLNSYHFEDNRLENSVIYYRLKQTDIDGRYTTSDIESVLIKNESNISFYPNPVKDEINLIYDSNQNSDKTINIFDYKGLLIFSNVFKIKEGYNDIHLELSNLKPGVYIIKVDDMVKKFECNNF